MAKRKQNHCTKHIIRFMARGKNSFCYLYLNSFLLWKSFTALFFCTKNRCICCYKINTISPRKPTIRTTCKILYFCIRYEFMPPKRVIFFIKWMSRSEHQAFQMTKEICCDCVVVFMSSRRCGEHVFVLSKCFQSVWVKSGSQVALVILKASSASFI